MAIGLALIFAVDRPLDMCRTVVNITGDSILVLVADSLGKYMIRKKNRGMTINIFLNRLIMIQLKRIHTPQMRTMVTEYLSTVCAEGVV